MIEKTVLFGCNKELTGIVSEPESSCQVHLKTAVIFLNAGLIHRCGCFRLHTDLSRQLVRMGFSSLRFDLHGIGDSSHIRSSLPAESIFLQDIKEAIDFIGKEIGIEQIILFGFCSGADQAHITAVNDERVKGAILIDGYAYRTLKFFYYDYSPGLFNFKRYPSVLKKNLISLFSSIYKHQSSNLTYISGPEIYIRNFPEKNKTQSEIRQLVDRGVRLMYIYSGGMPRYYNYDNQFREMFSSVNFKGNITYRYIKEADHTFTRLCLRNILYNFVITWLRDNFITFSRIENINSKGNKTK
ncbi:MAG: hypothetical protein GX640_06830 [Fibrobacter sp.]|nr:hypothetical protein [Fibrobacter sp.]